MSHLGRLLPAIGVGGDSGVVPACGGECEHGLSGLLAPMSDQYSAIFFSFAAVGEALGGRIHEPEITPTYPDMEILECGSKEIGSVASSPLATALREGDEGEATEGSSKRMSALAESPI
ncbi:hypothetical protein COCNU_14G009960 [Cocos nucifera]|uniref:Uncharacterized protein n=1 Tax=Cocos nucifera TaxID=13894 RepID=A0A8K0IW09_COCNU|nr:hypothetical protein COCNU_14G009960 [Cocos nucifera]